MKFIKFIVTALPALLLFSMSGALYAGDAPRFVSLKHNNANARKGPGRQYPIDWVYKRKGLPIEVTLEYADWRKVKDPMGDESWMHKSQLSSKRTALAVPSGGKKHVWMFAQSSSKSKIISRVQSGAILKILKCDPQWCKVSYADYYGWVQRKSIWGIYQAERID